MGNHSQSNSGKGFILRFGCAVLGLVLTTLPTLAQTKDQVAEYSAKFVCGTPTSAQVAAETIAAGTYSTSINIHNPASSLFTVETVVSFYKKAVLSQQEGVTQIPPSEMVQDNLLNDYAESCRLPDYQKATGFGRAAGARVHRGLGDYPGPASVCNWR